MLRVGVIGAGNMGRGMAKSLVQSGRFEVFQFDVNAQSLEASVLGCQRIQPVQSLEALCKAASDVIVVSVAGEEAERAVFFGSPSSSGVLDLVRQHASDAVVIGCGTTTVGLAREVHEVAAGQEGNAVVPYLDAPVSGGPEGADKGTLTFFSGGSESVFLSNATTLAMAAMGQNRGLLGGPGAGAAAKLVNQLLTASNALGAAEGLALAVSLGCELSALIPLLEKSWGQSTMLLRSGPIVMAALSHGDSLTHPDVQKALHQSSSAPLRNFAKDLDYVLEAAAESELQLSAATSARETVRVATEANLDHIDWAAVAGRMRLNPSDSKRARSSGAPLPSQPEVEAAPVFASVEALEAALPPLWHEDECALYMQASLLAARRPTPLAVIDDDPTGTQTVHSVPVLGDWGVDTLQQALGDRLTSCFYVLSNTRALTEPEAIARAADIASNLRQAAINLGISPSAVTMVSRGDSTLRGHYPAEVDALSRGLHGGDSAVKPLVLLAPYFFEGGRFTAHDMHYVSDPSGQLTPAADTEFARDTAFGYSHSHLRAYVEEKTGGNVRATDVLSLSLDTIRVGGPTAVRDYLLEAAFQEFSGNDTSLGPVVVANALQPKDMQVIGLGCLMAETVGLPHGILYRSAGSLVAARAAIQPKPLLTSSELNLPQEKTSGRAGVIVVGSYVGKSTEQLRCLRHECGDWLDEVELAVPALARGGDHWVAEEARARQAVAASLRAKRSVVVYTSREVLQSNDGVDGLAIGQSVTNAICSLVRGLMGSNSNPNPDFLIAKGGITSNDIAVEALGVKRATVLGQVVPGVPAWRCGDETRRPGLAYVVFPGNVGQPDDLARVARIMAGREAPPTLDHLVGHPGVSELLCDARDAGRAVGAFNVYNLEGALAVATAVERTGLPAILQIHPASMEFGGTAFIAACLDICHKCTTLHAPLLLQLDHASEAADIETALAAGVHGVMADGCHMALDANTEWTRRMTQMAHSHGAAVEAELGKLAGEEDGLSVPEKEARMTDPMVVADFLRETQVDALAVTIGNVHGKYALDPPVLDWERLDATRTHAGDTPLVLHGASGLPEHMVHRAIRAGVTKFNVNTEVRAAARSSSRQTMDFDLLSSMEASKAAMTEVIMQKMIMFAPDQ